MKLRALAAMAVLACILTSTASRATPRTDVDFFISNMVERHGMDAANLRTLLSPLKAVPAIVKAVSAPSTSRPWHEYRPLFLDRQRIDGGVRFWNENLAALQRAREIFHVPEAIIVAIVGVETRYGRQVGNFRVLDALFTLAFEVPGRNEYFKGELEAFLLLCREQGWDPPAVRGSYAGAMGLPQFMPNSYRKQAVDFNDNHRVDLWAETTDVIGSVANFLSNHGWHDGEPIVMQARLEGDDLVGLLAMGIAPHSPVRILKARGVQPQGEVDEQLVAGVFSLENKDGPEHWLAFNNFNALLQYNRSRNYAMSVVQLASEITRERQRRLDSGLPAGTAVNGPAH